MSDAIEEVLTSEPAPKATRKKSTKQDAAAALNHCRDWQDVVPRIRELKEAGATVPEIAEELQLSYVLVNQVMMQSYKMSVDTIGVFERQERKRLSIE